MPSAAISTSSTASNFNLNFLTTSQATAAKAKQDSSQSPCRISQSMEAPQTPQTTSHKVLGTRQPGMSYVNRHAVRAVVQNAAKEVAVIHVKEGNFYKLPGGGVEAGEDHHETARREMLEETGCTITIHSNDYFATTEEFRHHLHQFSYCYRADLLNDTGKPTLTEEEISDGFTHSWMAVEKALEVMAAVEPTSELGQFIKHRDIYLLNEAMKER
ncbi:hypothetical protein FQN55_004103 [Onygenales sp. PD_40]|nr:hypothetical protein FQN55_004103 [Onygenales sp. PD_40]